MDEKRTPMESRSTEELGQLLQREGDTMPTEELLQLLEELDSRKSGASDAEAAWKRFQTDYLADAEEPQPRKSWRRGLVAAAAVLVLVVGIPMTAGAISGGDLWQIIVNWTKDTFVISGTEQLPTEEQPKVYETFYEEVYAETGISGLVPTWIPEEFELAEIERTEQPGRIAYRAWYVRDEQYLRLMVQTHLPEEATHIERDDTPVESYTENGVDYYIVHNGSRMTAVWIKDGYECLISGDVTREEMEQMLESVS